MKVVDWPGNSPDLNPIENIFGIMKRELGKVNTQRSDILIAEVQRVWNEQVTPELCSKLARSMPRRIRMVIEKAGGSIKY